MRIGVNCWILQPDMGGIRQYFMSLFRELLSHDHDNDYLFFYGEHNRAELEKLGSGIVNRQGIFVQSQRDIREYLDRIDLYFCPLGSLIPRPLPVPTVVTLVDIQEVYFPGFFTFYNLVARFWHYVGSSKMADQVVTISDFSKKTIAEHHKIAPARITVAHLCADRRFYQAGETARRPEAELPERYIFYPANRWRHKNHDVLLRAMAMLRDRQVTVNAVFTGYDQENGYPIHDKARQYGLSANVFQLGYVSVEEMAYLYLHADLMVFPSLFEGFGIPLVEAMAAGCPVLSSDRASLPEVGGEAAAYFDPSFPEALAAQLHDLLAGSRHRQELKSLGHERARQFSAGAMAAGHLLAFSKARQSYAKTRYRYLRLYKYLHAARTLGKALRLGLCRTCRVKRKS